MPINNKKEPKKFVVVSVAAILDFHFLVCEIAKQLISLALWVNLGGPSRCVSHSALLQIPSVRSYKFLQASADFIPIATNEPP